MHHLPRRYGHLRLVYSAPEPRRNWTFTGIDMMELALWTVRQGNDGYRRSAVEGGNGSREESACFVLLYAPGRPWAEWGLTRAGGEICVWHCATGTDLARFSSMARALDDLPSAPAAAPTSRKRECIRERVLAFV